MFINPKTKIDCPICSKHLIWVDNGPRFQYFYCRDCKKELAELERDAPKPAIDYLDNLPEYRDGWYY